QLDDAVLAAIQRDAEAVLRDRDQLICICHSGLLRGLARFELMSVVPKRHCTFGGSRWKRDGHQCRQQREQPTYLTSKASRHAQMVNRETANSHVDSSLPLTR